jgi:hypothetical protein
MVDISVDGIGKANDEIGHLLLSEVLQLVALAASQSVTLQDTYRMVRMLRLSALRIAPWPASLCPTILHSLMTIAAGLTTAPLHFFDFCGVDSALILPRIDKWSCPKAYTVCCWLKWDPDQLDLQGVLTLITRHNPS